MRNILVDPRKRFPGLPMTGAEAQAVLNVESSSGHILKTNGGCMLALMLLRARDEAELNKMLEIMERERGIKFED